MKNEEVIDLVKQCDLSEGKELIPGKAYLFNKKFREFVGGRIEYNREEIIVLVESGIKVGGIYRMGSVDIHIVMEEKYEGQHILSNFLKTNIIEKIWPENTSVELCGVYTQAEYDKKKYLAQLCHMSIKNEKEIEKRLKYIEECKKKYKR